MSRRTLDTAVCLKISCTRLSLSSACFPKTIPLSLNNNLRGPQPRRACSSVWPFSTSLAATMEIDFSFSSCRYLDVSVHGVPSVKLFIHLTVTALLTAGFPHSDTRGSLTVCVSPRLFAAFCVLLRFLMPRHSPFALISLTFDIYMSSFTLFVSSF